VLSGGRYYLTRRADVLAALRNPKTFATPRRRTFHAFGLEQVPISYQGAASTGKL
jgi:hypothetical protein